MAMAEGRRGEVSQSWFPARNESDRGAGWGEDRTKKEELGGPGAAGRRHQTCKVSVCPPLSLLFMHVGLGL